MRLCVHRVVREALTGVPDHAPRAGARGELARRARAAAVFAVDGQALARSGRGARGPAAAEAAGRAHPGRTATGLGPAVRARTVVVAYGSGPTAPGGASG
ncbi:hypothetical protein [Streptomyces sp. NPDC093094]|uniref:hypothetical protein n=1 Tax=Streptomyces sp. NPDC093094 TaxID=3366026 RepID=UPI0038204656